ncbi:hypothetical protein DJ69_13090 [Halorubrum persicum]|uniref:Polysaccharide pyruvyl transferase domain-containing protein n=1 Tax=Halorubrum persicum TaxID=1383844 RepID=A0A2G1WGP5_9EURY|nr:polysaccharide pyruvyl transferase family protein [Halorubrum persicum]PHQ38151.1 hypothetical protein DJ69_13090 [Halorubrum persicum]
MLALFKSLPDDGSYNVGDKLIGESAAEFIDDITDERVVSYYDVDELLEDIDLINESKALLIAAFGIRSSIWRPKLADAIVDGSIGVPVVPLASAWSDFPGDYEQLTSENYPQYDRSVVQFYQYVAKHAPAVSSRDYYTQKALEGLDISSRMVGDCAWYDLESLGEKMCKPEKIDKLVVTDPHQSQYFDQAESLMSELGGMFPDAEKLFCTHGDPSQSPKRQELASNANKYGFEKKDVSGDVSNISFYSDCDLHVGYRVHGHVGFLRKRRPSVLLCEDGRGLGFTETLGGCGFPAFTRRVPEASSTPKKILQTFPEGTIHQLQRKYLGGDRVSHPTTPARDDVVDQVTDFIHQELTTGWHRYEMIPAVIDETYEREMKPFIREISNI